jgi:hypothetical protein
VLNGRAGGEVQGEGSEKETTLHNTLMMPRMECGGK